MRLLTEIGLVFARQTALSLRSPAWIIIGLVQPVLYLALFGPLLGTVAEVASFPAGDSWQVFVPGLLVMQSLFSAAFVGFGVIAEQRNGVLERMRVTPVSRLALLLGRVFRDMLVLLAQSLVLLATAFAFGLRAPVPGMLIGLGLIVLLGAGVSSLSYALALRLGDENALAPIVNSVTMPVLLLSGVLLPLSFAPAWLSGIASVNPFLYVVEATREAFLADYTAPALVLGTAVAVGFAALGLFAGTRAFQRQVT